MINIMFMWTFIYFISKINIKSRNINIINIRYTNPSILYLCCLFFSLVEFSFEYSYYLHQDNFYYY